tara:strand:+ start:6104 stop:6919 length:816 start_codon:yes stop_codon:yes gene_type:complete
MSTEIEKLLGKEKDKNCHVVGHGPSLEEYLPKLSVLDKNKDIIFSVNDVDTMTDLYPDYWLTTNPDYNVRNIYKRINSFPETTFLYSDCYDLTPFNEADNLLDVEYYSFDSLHFKTRPNIFYVKGWRLGCDRGWINCCSNIIDKRLTVQEYLQKISDYENHYSSGDTGILHALAFAVILGSKNINLYGVDLDYNLGYVNGNLTDSDGKANHGDSFDYWMDRIMSDFYIINESAKMLEIKINYLGYNEKLKNIFVKNYKPEKVYESSCRNYN